MTEIKYSSEGGTPAERIAKRLQNSGVSRGKNEATPTYTVQTGDSARRTFHNVHETGNVHGARVQNKGGSNDRGNV